MMIAVLPEHIRKGEKGNSAYCPIALALMAEFPSWHFYVSDEAITYYTGKVETLDNRHVFYPESIVVRDFVRRFDDYGPGYVTPITFQFEVTP